MGHACCELPASGNGSHDSRVLAFAFPRSPRHCAALAQRTEGMRSELTAQNLPSHMLHSSTLGQFETLPSERSHSTRFMVNSMDPLFHV